VLGSDGLFPVMSANSMHSELCSCRQVSRGGVLGIFSLLLVMEEEDFGVAPFGCQSAFVSLFLLCFDL